MNWQTQHNVDRRRQYDAPNPDRADHKADGEGQWQEPQFHQAEATKVRDWRGRIRARGPQGP